MPKAKSPGQNKHKDSKQQTKLRLKKKSKPRNHQLDQSKPDQIFLSQNSHQSQNNTKLTAHKNIVHSNLNLPQNISQTKVSSSLNGHQ